MDMYWRRRGLLLASSPLVLVILLRKRSIQLAIAILVYLNAESLLGVTPYGSVELVEFFSSNMEGVIAFVGLIVAFAAGRGFIESKQLDLRLELEEEIAGLSEDASQLLAVCRRAAKAMITVSWLGDTAVRNSVSTNSPTVVFPAEMDPAFRELVSSSKPLAQAQRELADFDERFGKINRKFGPVVRSSLISSFALERAAAALERISRTTSLMVVEPHWSVEGYLVLRAGHRGAQPEQFLTALKADELRFQAWMGAASAVGAGSIFRPSVLISVRLWWRLWKLRE